MFNLKVSYGGGNCLNYDLFRIVSTISFKCHRSITFILIARNIFRAKIFRATETTTTKKNSRILAILMRFHICHSGCFKDVNNW